jgi:hypothetical protein
VWLKWIEDEMMFLKFEYGEGLQLEGMEQI